MASIDQILSYFSRRQHAFQIVFSRTNPADIQVLADIHDFCCANTTTAISNDPIQMAIREGRRQVWLRINRAIALTPEEQFNLASQKDKP